MSAHPPRSLFGRFRSLAHRDRAAPGPAPPLDPAPAGQPAASAEAIPVWAMVASVTGAGADAPEDLKDFAPGTKVYVLGPAGGTGPEAVGVIGRGRKASRFVTATVLAEHLTDWRVEPVYSPAVLRRLGQGGHGRWPCDGLDPSGDGYRLELLDLAAGFARRHPGRPA